MDVLTALLSDLKLKCAFHIKADFTAPWSVNIEQERTASFHFVMHGECFLEFENGDSFTMEAGDLLLLPHGTARILTSRKGMKPVPLLSLLNYPLKGWYADIEHGGGGKEACVCGGALNIRRANEHKVIKALPNWILVKASELEASTWFKEHLRCLFDEAEADRPGGGMIISRMSEIIFLHALRVYIYRDDQDKNPFFKALENPRIGKALKAMHLHPENAWTVASLAKEASMSRASFAIQFPEFLGSTPIEYLTQLRIHKAATLLRDSDFSVLDIALRVGYQTQASLSTAFRKHYGIPPGRYRKQSVV